MDTQGVKTSVKGKDPMSVLPGWITDCQAEEVAAAVVVVGTGGAGGEIGWIMEIDLAPNLDPM